MKENLVLFMNLVKIKQLIYFRHFCKNYLRLLKFYAFSFDYKVFN